MTFLGAFYQHWGQCQQTDLASPRAIALPPVGLHGQAAIAALTTPPKISAERFGRVRRAYIEARLDRAISLEMEAALPGETVMTLESDHSRFYSAAPELAQH